MTTADLDRAPRSSVPAGKVAFVGTGPGDARLLTVQAVEAIAQADAIFADFDATGFVTGLSDVQVTIFDEAMTLAARMKAVLAAAKSGGTVIRLVAGDPSTDAQTFEELAHAVKNDFVAELLPAVSPHVAVPAFAGIPLVTPRSKDVRFIEADAKHDWASVATAKTIVIRGTKEDLGKALKGLSAAGLASSTQVSVTVAGSTIEQQTFVTSIAEISTAIKMVPATDQLIAVIGDVINQRESWFETKPLFGWKVLIPRTKEVPGALNQVLRSFGATSLEVPTIGVEPPRTPQQMEKAIRSLVTGRYEWVAFTSVNAVRAVWERIEELGLDARALAGTKVAVVSEEVAAAVRAHGVRPDLQPATDESSHGLLEAFPAFDHTYDPINRVFLPRADIATETLVEGLQKKGWETEDVTAYRTVRSAPPEAAIRDAIKSGGFDAVLFTSSSTVRNLIGIAGKPHPLTVVACIGSATAKTAEEHGLRVDVIASEPDAEVLVRELAEHGESLRRAAAEAGESVWRPTKRKNRKKQA